MTPIEDLRHTVANCRLRRRWNIAQTVLACLLIAAVIVLLPGLMSRRDENAELRAIAETDNAFRAAWIAARDLDYRLCPPADPTRPSVLVFVIENASDKHPLYKTCFRIPREAVSRQPSVGSDCKLPTANCQLERSES